MKILLVNHGTAGDWGGGDGVQMRETAKLLQFRGHEIHLINSDRPDVKGFDLVHLFNCRVHYSFQQQMNQCKEAQVPVVVSPIWVSISKALWGSRGALAVLNKAVEEGISSAEGMLQQLEDRSLTVMLQDGSINANGQGTYIQSGLEVIKSCLKEADGLIPNSWLELQAIRSDLHWDGDIFEIAHYGVNPKCFLDASELSFREKIGIEGPFIMQAGRIEPAKNQAMVCWALRDTDIPIVLIGSGKHWPGYSELCKKISGNKIHIIDHLPQDLLASAYAAASVHVLPSWMETCGLVSLEASLTGTPLVGSTFGHELEYLGNDAWYADPASARSIKKAIEEAYQAGKNCKKALAMKRKVLAEFNWEQAVESTERLYEKVIQNKK